MKGTYIFYEDGKEIYREDNVITKFGKRFLTNYLAGTVQFNNKDIAIGIMGESDYAAADTNSRLGFEFYRLPVGFGTFDIQESNGSYIYNVVYKTTLPQDIAGVISEIGLYPGTRTSLNNFDSKMIADFEENLYWNYSDNTHPSLSTAVDPKIGNYVLKLEFEPGNTLYATKEITRVLSMDISGYSGNDTLALALNRADSNSEKIKVKFYSSMNDYYYGTFNLSGSGDIIQEINMSDVFSHQEGSPNPSIINQIGIELTRSSEGDASLVYLDGLRINDEDTFDPAFGLVSRSTLSTPITKYAGRRMDIEYKLDLGFTTWYGI